MYKNRNNDGTLNICGSKIAKLRKELIPPVSQKGLADLLQLSGIDLDKNAIQRMESGKRFITDIELKAMAKLFRVTADYLLED